MSRAVQFDPDTMEKPKGRLPALQYLPPSELEIDSGYQRSIEGYESQKLIKKIATGWNWDLCQPLVVSRREERLFVIDGQHRLAAARLRGDIQQLPCVVGAYDNMQAEAATFSALNQERRPLSALEKFKAAVASGEQDAVDILAAIERSGLALAQHGNPNFWEPGMIANVGGIRKAWKTDGAKVTELALTVLGSIYKGQVLTYAGTLFPGIVLLCRGGGGDTISDERLKKILEVLPTKTQGQWRAAQLVYMSNNEGIGRAGAMFSVMADVIEGKPLELAREVKAVKPAELPEAAPIAGHKDKFDAVEAGEKIWCDQCEKLRSPEQVRSCGSRWCTLANLGQAA